MASKVSRKAHDLDSSLISLSISNPKQKPKSAPPESWEEDATSNSYSSSGSTNPSPPSTPNDTTPGPPPPTPMSPSHRRGKSTDWASFPPFSPSGLPPSAACCTSSKVKGDGSIDKRPEKSSATAGRLIAGALGVKTPRMSEEGRKYEKALREKERKRIEKEREEEARQAREAAQAKKAVWDS